MDLREIKKLTAYARKNGIKSLKVNGFELELHESAIFAHHGKPLPVVPGDPATKPAPKSEPTIDEINQYIYGNNEVG